MQTREMEAMARKLLADHLAGLGVVLPDVAIGGTRALVVAALTAKRKAAPVKGRSQGVIEKA